MKLRGSGKPGVCVDCAAMSTSALLHAMFEAAAGDRAGDVEPVFISLRDTGADIVLVNVRVADRAMTATYDVLDPKLDHDDVTVLFCETYLRRLMGDALRADVDTITLRARDCEPQAAFAYPSWEPDEPEVIEEVADIDEQLEAFRAHIDRQMLLLDAPAALPIADVAPEGTT